MGNKEFRRQVIRPVEGRGPNYTRDVAGNVPLSTISQTIHIMIPIDYNRLPNYSNKPVYFNQGKK